MHNLFPIGDDAMARPKGIRALALERGIPLNNRQVKNFREYGLLPDRTQAESHPEDIERLRQILAAAERAQTLDRRLFYLHDPDWPIPVDCVRKAVTEVANKIRIPDKKNRALYRCLQAKSQMMHGSKIQKTVPQSWRLPEKSEWSRILEWPTDDDFQTVYGSCRSEIIALSYRPGMRESDDFKLIPFEEMVVLLLLHQLSVPPQSLPMQTKETDPWP
jgi:hypothetical protein